jgi:sugar phosphate isomerase/epimerase
MLYTLGEPFEKMVEEIPGTKVRFVEVLDEGVHALDKHRVAVLRDVAESLDLEFTVHAPFAGVNIALHSESLLNASLKRLKESIVNAAALGCRMWVFHPGMKTGISMFYPGGDWTRNLANIRLIAGFAEECGVEAALENIMEPFVLKNVAEFKRFYDEVNVDLGLAFDTGHANVVGEVEAFLKEFSDKLVHVHAHDNLGKTDQHLGIGYGNIDWENVADLLKQASFDKIVIVESVEHIEESVKKLKHLLF